MKVWAEDAAQYARTRQAEGAATEELEEAWNNALVAYDLLLDREPNSRTALRGVAECYRKLGRAWEASTILSQLIRLDPQHNDIADLYSERGEVFHEYGWTDDTIRDFTKALHHRPGNADLLSRRAEFALAARDIPLALHDIEESMQGNLTERQWIAKAKVLTYLRLYDRAEQACQEALNLAPDKFEPLRQQALLKFARQEYTTAIPLLEMLNERAEASRHPIWQALVDCHIASGDHQAAVKVLEQEIQRHPEAVYLYYELADRYMAADQEQLAADTLLNALISPGLQRHGQQLSLRYKLARFYGAIGNWAEAAYQYQAALALEDAPYIGDRLELIVALNKCGKHDQALSLCNRFMEKARESGWEPAFHLQKAAALTGQKQFQAALALLQRTPQGYVSQRDDYHQTRADLYLAAGQTEPALAELQLLRSGSKYNAEAADKLITLLESTDYPQTAVGERWLQLRQLDNRNCIIADDFPSEPQFVRLRPYGPEPPTHY